MKSVRNLLFFLFIGLFLDTVAYIPPIINASLVNNKGEFQAALTYGTAGAEQYFAYNIDSELFVYFSSSFTIDTVYNGGDKRKHMFFEGGFGYCTTAGNWVFSMGGSYGFGQFYNYYSNLITSSIYDYDNAYLSANNHKFSIQADIGLKKPFMELIFSNRFAVGHFSSNDSRYKIKNSTISFFEPGVTLKAGPGKVKFMTQFRLGLPLNRLNSDMSYGAISIGLVLHLGKTKEE